ncbi:MAG: sugar phosphate isomerase/epimerase [Lachnospiraceae bacterium]|nr:sugar phosphate isomerase/epimerase [Lachnospiraceae bacterium]
MKYTLAAFADEASPLLKNQIKAMKENGVSALEIRGVDGENVADISKEKAKEIIKRLKDEGLYVWSIGSPYGKIGLNDDFSHHLDKFKRTLEICDILETKHIRLFSFYGAENRFDDVCERLEKFVTAADGTGILLCHENEKGIYGDIASRCLEIHKTFPQIKAIFDPANFIQSGQDTVKAWDMLGSYVEYMHIKDALLDGSVVPAGRGEGNIPYILSKYKGKVLTVEPHLSVFDGLDKLEAGEKSKIFPYTYGSPAEAFKAAVDAIKDIVENMP